MKDLENKNAIVTGARRGIGRAIVEEFAMNGCNVWACARKQDDDFEKDMEQLSVKYGVWIKPIYFDLSDTNQIKEGFKSIYKEKKSIDVLVNNAGILHQELFQMTTMEQIYEVYQTNVFATMQLTQLVLKVMTRNKKGSIIHISSISGLNGNPLNCIYGSSKAAIASFTKLLASEIGNWGIRVNSVAPGDVYTDMIQTVESVLGGTLLKDSIEKECFLSRFGEPEEIAKVVSFLASDKSSFVNGQVIRVDGGRK